MELLRSWCLVLEPKLNVSVSQSTIIMGRSLTAYQCWAVVDSVQASADRYGFKLATAWHWTPKNYKPLIKEYCCLGVQLNK